MAEPSVLVVTIQWTQLQEFSDVVPVLCSVLHRILSRHQILQARAGYLGRVMDAQLSDILHKYICTSDNSCTVRILCTKSGLVVEANTRINLGIALVHAENCVMRFEYHDLVERLSLGSKVLEEPIGFNGGGTHPHVHGYHLVRGKVPGQLHDHLDLRSLHCLDEASAILLRNQHRWNMNPISIAVIRHDDVGQTLCSEV
mmetsp:Transcript_5481/g.6378  ORF Transcript_5481/g.6378 Transcript_5481/m.6378 type:complete len:200 (-) Transcript_5481:411-1010(-)